MAAADQQHAEAAAGAPPPAVLRSQLEQIQEVLLSLHTPLPAHQHVPSITAAFSALPPPAAPPAAAGSICNSDSAATTTAVAAKEQHSMMIANWASLPPSVDADSTVGTPTRTPTTARALAKKQAKHASGVVLEKLQARVARKRAQVEESFVCVCVLLCFVRVCSLSWYISDSD